MAGGLGRSKQMGNEERNADNEIEEMREQGASEEVKKKKVRKSKTVETNLKNINLNKLDLDFDVDPFFKKSSALINEGRSGGSHFVTTLTMKDDGCQLLLDSEFVFNLDSSKSSIASDSFVSIPKITGFEDRVICPSLNGFSFLRWDPSGDEKSEDKKRKSNEMNDSYAFDLDAPVEPVPEADDNNYPADDFSGLDVIEEDDREDMLPTNLATPALTNRYLKEPTIEQLSTVPLEYSYFIKNKNLGWAGPMHLRFRPQKGLQLQPPGTEKKKRLKEVTRITYEDDVDFTKQLASSRVVIRLSKSSIRAWSTDKTTTPEDMHYEVFNLYKLFMRPEVSLVKSQPDYSSNPNLDDSKLQVYNYDNQNDLANFCPDLQDDDDVNPFEGDSCHFPDEPSSQTPPPHNNGEVPDFFGDNLVAAPNK
ncbi:hypothetical protein QYM36_017258, partial [Artemia franciscana]